MVLGPLQTSQGNQGVLLPAFIIRATEGDGTEGLGRSTEPRVGGKAGNSWSCCGNWGADVELWGPHGNKVGYYGDPGRKFLVSIVIGQGEG